MRYGRFPVPDRACLLAGMPRNGGLSSQTLTVLGPVLSLTAPVVWIFLFAFARPEGLRCAAALRLPYSVLAGNAPVKYTFGRL